ncbi:hypothetical protein AB4371_16705 [Vibrio sp. 10N.261.51.A3]|uniref:hypothetical protein n=2 Tax=Vibrio TaxID=662 RepID=UPI0010BDF92B|nr:hypothetical protein [Vibrio sp. F13]TKF41176.1 hypothetical protein FCV49_17955 [Vibrio sp. F13]TKF51287.1 hypothetical protein FCV60_18475 [Vibrio sp. F13]
MFRSTLTPLDDSQSLKHYSADINGAIVRAAAMFAGQNQYGYNYDGHFSFKPDNSDQITTLTIKEFISKFVESMQEVTILEFDKPTGKYLEINDVWDDDPVGSGGLSIFSRQSVMDDEYRELEQLFYPFTSIIYPQDIYQVFSKQDVKKIHKSLNQNVLGKKELKARKFRASKVGEDWTSSKNQESVWVYYTLELRKWAIKKGYDYFKYINNQESNGAYSFIALSDNTLQKRPVSYKFDSDKFVNVATWLLEHEMNKHNGGVDISNVIWCNQEPSYYWVRNDI